MGGKNKTQHRNSDYSESIDKVEKETEMVL